MFTELEAYCSVHVSKIFIASYELKEKCVLIQLDVVGTEIITFDMRRNNHIWNRLKWYNITQVFYCSIFESQTSADKMGRKQVRTLRFVTNMFPFPRHPSKMNNRKYIYARRSKAIATDVCKSWNKELLVVKPWTWL